MTESSGRDLSSCSDTPHRTPRMVDFVWSGRHAVMNDDEILSLALACIHPFAQHKLGRVRRVTVAHCGHVTSRPAAVRSQCSPL